MPISADTRKMCQFLRRYLNHLACAATAARLSRNGGRNVMICSRTTAWKRTASMMVTGRLKTKTPFKVWLTLVVMTGLRK